MSEGMKPIIIRPYTTDIEVAKSIFHDKATINFELEQEPNFIVDVGANIGLVSAYFANKYPNATIISLEPEQSNFDILKQNSKSYKNIIPIQKALWYENTTIDIFSTNEGNGGFIAIDGGYENETYRKILEEHTPFVQPKNVKVKTITMESIMQKYKIKFLDLVKIDIEGAEKDIFDNCQGWIEKVGLLITELHEWKRPGCTESFNKIQKYFNEGWQTHETLYLRKKT